MPAQLTYESPVFLPTLERAKKLVPQAFLPCYDWFMSNAGEKIPRLPHRMGLASTLPIPLSRDAGIYVPGAAQVEYDGGRKYALSIHSTGHRRYNDRAPIPLKDGTWVLSYAAHEGSDSSQGYNTALMNCLNDGVPVGVFVKEAPGYRVLGLAYVEQYNSVTRMFSLHGPISTATESAGSFVPHGFEELPENEQKILMELDGQDERRVVTAQQVRREQQGRFREALLRAYSETCAITGVNVPEVLQAAHINPYRGRKSQVVNNGILLRADLHLLYDAHLISVEPNSLSISLSGRLESTSYLRYNHQKLREPISADLGPNTDLLAVHYEQFRRENPVLVA